MWSTAVRDTATDDREDTSRLRDQMAHDRDVFAHRRDESSTLRDDRADDRDRQAADRDAQDDLADRHTLGVEALRGRARAGRARAASDRDQAGHDRDQAEGDRDNAEGDRDQAAYDREYAGTDDLTGARRRGVGLEELENEIRRARREGGGLVAAYVDVDGLKVVNDQRGHAAGDTLLRAVADGLRDHMRSYDLLVRLGGDEFLCALTNVTLTEARYRFDACRAKLKATEGSSISVGVSELRETDSSDEFIGRADSDLSARRRWRGTRGPAGTPP